MIKVDAAEFTSGLVIVAIGCFFFFSAYDYRMGTMTRMGPGFVPHWLGAVGMLLGAIVSLSAVGRVGPLPSVAWRPVLAVLVAIGAFAILLRPFGLIPAVLATTIISMLGNPKATVLSVVVTSVVVAVLCWAIFIEALTLPMRPLWFGR